MSGDALANVRHQPRPPVVCLCGSTRFGDAYAAADLAETLAGRIVLSVGCYTSSDADLGIDAAGETKAMLDELHLRKIDMADEVLILNVDGYVGDSTWHELCYAIGQGKLVRFLDRAAGIETLQKLVSHAQEKAGVDCGPVFMPPAHGLLPTSK